MKLDAQKIFLPLTIVAAVVGIWAAFRKSAGGTTVVLPNPASSGVTPSVGAQPYTFDTNIPGVSPVAIPLPSMPTLPSYIPSIAPGIPGNAAQAISDSTNGPPQTIADPTTPTPAYLTHNFGPRLALTKKMPTPEPPASSGCGGSCGMPSPACNTCNQTNAFPDGSGQSKMSSSRALQFAASSPGVWLQPWTDNAMSYLASVNDNG